MSAQRDPLAGRIPVTLVTGFLGSGKTTLISKLVRHPGMLRVAVVINEVGEIGIDHDLVAMSSENITLLANGCICCSVRTDLQETLRDLFARRRAGEIADFDRVIVETTGLADPAPVVQTLVSDTLLAAQYRLDGVVTLVDALLGVDQIARQPEAVKQLALADRIFITKSDMATPDGLVALTAAITAINPGARVSQIVHGEVDPAALTNLGLASARAGPATLSFLGESLDTVADAPRGRVAGQVGERKDEQASDKASDEAAGRYLGSRPITHDAAIKTLSLRFESPFTWASFSAALELLATLRGPDLLRVKGIVNVEGKPVVVQGIQHIFHPPVSLDRWPSADTRTRLVFITRNIEAELIRNLLKAVGEVAAPASTQPAGF